MDFQARHAKMLIENFMQDDFTSEEQEQEIMEENRQKDLAMEDRWDSREDG